MKKKEKVTEEVTKEKKTSKESPKKSSHKQDMRKAHKIEHAAMKNEKKKIEEQIDVLWEEKKHTKDKMRKKELKREIKDLQYQRSRIGKKDTYWSDVMAEMRLVRWPSRSEVIKYSLASFIFIAIFALFFFGIDALFALVKDLID